GVSFRRRELARGRPLLVTVRLDENSYQSSLVGDEFLQSGASARAVSSLLVDATEPSLLLARINAFTIESEFDDQVGGVRVTSCAIQRVEGTMITEAMAPSGFKLSETPEAPGIVTAQWVDDFGVSRTATISAIPNRDQCRFTIWRRSTSSVDESEDEDF